MWHKSDIEAARKHTKRNREEVLASSSCGCISCLTTFEPSDITEWTDEADKDHPEDKVDRTAVCPHCGEAMIIGSSSGHEITPAFLEAMRMR
jgi:hypothetical protein